MWCGVVRCGGGLRQTVTHSGRARHSKARGAGGSDDDPATARRSLGLRHTRTIPPRGGGRRGVTQRHGERDTAEGGGAGPSKRIQRSEEQRNKTNRSNAQRGDRPLRSAEPKTKTKPTATTNQTRRERRWRRRGQRNATKRGTEGAKGPRLPRTGGRGRTRDAGARGDYGHRWPPRDTRSTATQHDTATRRSINRRGLSRRRCSRRTNRLNRRAASYST